MTALHDRFFAAFARDPQRLRVARSPDLPPDMLSDERVAPPWVVWKLLPGRHALQVYRDWEERNGWRLPESFRAFLMARQTLRLDCGIARLVASPSHAPFLDLEELMEWDVPLIRAKKLLPVGDEAIGEVGPLCLDLRERTPEPPVVYCDAAEDTVSPPIWSSLPKMLEGLSFAMENDLRLWEDERLLEAFLALDPAGAGGPGREYWSRDAEEDGE
ncbi:MAG: SMI1/KNR4 family protein [Candidatus Brocadiae bacterium]|nr:SMI1/KNR4 family protein [Candidatus Brocadiia bacterium]